MSDKANWSSIFKILAFARRHWVFIALTMGSMTVFAAGEGYYIKLMGNFFDHFMAFLRGREATALNVTTQDLYHLGIKAMLMAPVLALAAFGQDFFRGCLVWRLVVDMRNAVCRALLPQSLAFFEDRRSGDLMSRITNDVGRSQQVFTQMFGSIPENALQLLMGAVLAGWAAWREPVLLLSAVALPVVIVPVGILARRIRHYGRKGLEKLGDLTDLMAQMFSGIRVIKAFRMEEAEAQEFERTNEKYRSRMMKMVTAHGLSAGSIELIIRFFIGVGIVLGGWLLSRRGATLEISTLAIFIGGSYYAFNATRKLVKAYNNLQECMPACERVLDLVEAVPSLRDAPNACPLPRVQRGIAFERVSFTYDDEPVLRDISFEAKRGETIAVVGRSGAGKSTLVALIPRFYDVTEGAVKIDGVDVRQITRESLLSHFAIVTQQTFLFNRSIADNIRYGKPGASMAEVEAAARAANIHDFIVSQEHGYNALCGEFGAKLSGGQRQRIAIARALLKDADILLLDEAMVGLDAESEATVREALARLMKNRTTFVITHDLSTIRNADRIVVLRDGQLIGCGNHDELMAQQGEYCSLYSLQFAAFGERQAPSRPLSDY